MAITLTNADLTTAWRQHLDTLTPPVNEAELVALKTLYGVVTTDLDLSTLVSRLLKTRQAP